MVVERNACEIFLVIKTICLSSYLGEEELPNPSTFFWTFYFLLVIKGKGGTKRGFFSPLNSSLIASFMFVTRSPGSRVNNLLLCFLPRATDGRGFPKHCLSCFFTKSTELSHWAQTSLLGISFLSYLLTQLLWHWPWHLYYSDTATVHF